MSYEPQLLINYDQLQSHRENIECVVVLGTSKNYKGRKGEKALAQLNAYKELSKALKLSPIVFEWRIKLVVIRPELTSHNKLVRRLLDMLEIEYREDN